MHACCRAGWVVALQCAGLDGGVQRRASRASVVGEARSDGGDHGTCRTCRTYRTYRTYRAYRAYRACGVVRGRV